MHSTKSVLTKTTDALGEGDRLLLCATHMTSLSSLLLLTLLTTLHYISFHGSVLTLFSSYPLMFEVFIRRISPKLSPNPLVSLWVLLFSLYTLSLGKLIISYSFQCHLYDDEPSSNSPFTTLPYPPINVVKPPNSFSFHTNPFPASSPYVLMEFLSSLAHRRDFLFNYALSFITHIQSVVKCCHFLFLTTLRWHDPSSQFSQQNPWTTVL